MFDETFAANVRAPFLLTAAIAPRMVERGGGKIVNVTTMAAEYGPQGVRVNAVSPARRSRREPTRWATASPQSSSSPPTAPAT
jgi:NAD(P)-dependent dehydrogenase (short-subunit alcohol dehydrogenase family)